jgi:large repetitive protein
VRQFRVLNLAWMAALLATTAQAALTFNSGTLGTGTVSATVYGLTPSGGTPPYTFSYTPSTTPIPGFQVVNSPNVPASLTAAQTGALIGIPSSASHTQTATYTASIRLTDSTSAFVDKSVTILVTPVDFAGAVPSNTAVGDNVNVSFFGVDGTPPYTFSATGTTPPGLILNASTGIFSGVLTTAGSFTFTLKLTDSFSTPQTVTHTYTMTVSALQITNVTGRTLPNGTINVPYSFQFQVQGGTPPYTFAVGSGFNLPSGLSLSSSGLLSGTVGGPSASSNYSFGTQITISDRGGNANSVRMAINILPAAPTPLGFSTDTLNDASLGDNSAPPAAATGGVPPYTYSVAPGSTLPAGCFLQNGTSLLPNDSPDHAYLRSRFHTAGNYSFVLQVTDSAGNTATHPYAYHASQIGLFYAGGLPVGNAATPVLGTPYSWYLIPIGGVPPYTVAVTEIPAGLTVDNTGFLSGTPNEVGNTLPLDLTLTDSSSNTYNSVGNITINSTSVNSLLCSGGDLGIAQLGDPFSSNINCTGSPQNPPVFSVTPVAGTLPPGLVVLTGTNFDNGGNANIAAQIAGIPNASGNYTYTLQVEDGLGNIGQRQIKLHVSNLALVNTGIASGTVGVAYSQTFDLRGGVSPYTFTPLGTLPTGLQMSSSNGTISGTPSTSGSSAITVQVTDNTGDTFARNYTLDIYDVQITNPNVMPYATYGQPYNYTFAVSSPGGYQWTTPSNLPTGLTLNASTGALSGVTTNTSGTNVLTIVASNGSVSVTKSFTLFVTSQEGQAILNGLPTQPLGDFALGAQVRAVVDVQSGTPPYTVALASGSTLPPGLSLVPDNQYTGTSGFGRFAIAGVPTSTGSYSFRLNYTDSAGLTEGRLVSMNITKLGVATTTPQDAILNTAYAAQLFGTGGNGTYTFALANLHNNVMPSGLSLNSHGQITGTPTSTGSYTIPIQMSSGSASRLIDATITIDPSATLTGINTSFGPVIDDTVAGRRFTTLIAPTITPTSGIGTLTWSVVGALPPGVQLYQGSSLPSTYPGTAVPPQAVLAGPTVPGNYNVGIKVTDSTGNFGIQYTSWHVGTLYPGPINLSNNLAIPPGQAGVPYSFQLTSISGQTPFTFSLDVGGYLPSGMGLSSSGLLSGTPADPGNYLLYAIITDANSVVQHLTQALTVYPAGHPIGLDVSQNAFLPSGTVSTPYAFGLNTQVTQGWGTAPFTWTVASGNSLPPGLSVVAGSGGSSATLAGTPSSAGQYTFSLLVTDANGRVALSYNDVMDVSPLTVSPPGESMPAATLGSSYAQDITTTGGTPPYSYALDYISALPSGLSLSPGGVISGTPVGATGPFVVDVLVSDAANNLTLQGYPITVLAAGTSSGTVLSVDPLTVNVAYEIGNTPPTYPVTFSTNAGSLPFILTITSIAGGSWLSIPTSGTAPATIPFGFSPAGLAPGDYSATVLASGGGGAPPVTIQVNLTVLAGGACSFSLTPGSAGLPATGTSTVETCPNNSGQPNCGVAPETAVTFAVIPTAACGAWTATSSSPRFLQITSGASGSGAGTVSFVLLNNTHNGQQNDTITVASGAASATYSVTQAGSGDSEVYREVYALYEQLLGRDPDPAGFAFWSGSGGAGLGQMADSFLTSPEAFNSDFAVMATYQAATGAPPTYAQYTAAVTGVRAGTESVPGLFNALMGPGYTATTLYENLLNRAPAGADSTCVNTGLTACFQALIGFPSNTTPVGAANNEFQSTGIYRTSPDHTNALYVQMIYYVTVSRDPDAAGLAFWIGIANGGGPGLLFQGSNGYPTRLQILGPGTPNQGFIGSPEFQGLFAN